MGVKYTNYYKNNCQHCKKNFHAVPLSQFWTKIYQVQNAQDRCQGNDNRRGGSTHAGESRVHRFEDGDDCAETGDFKRFPHHALQRSQEEFALLFLESLDHN